MPALKVRITGGGGALAPTHVLLPPLPSQGRVLAELEAQVLKRCNADVGGCGAEGAMPPLLQGPPPAAVTLQLAWESQCQGGEDIAGTLAVVREVRRCSRMPQISDACVARADPLLVSSPGLCCKGAELPALACLAQLHACRAPACLRRGAVL